MLTRRKTGFVLHTIRLVKRYQFDYYLFGVYSQYTQNNDDGQLKGQSRPSNTRPPTAAVFRSNLEVY